MKMRHIKLLGRLGLGIFRMLERTGKKMQKLGWLIGGELAAREKRRLTYAYNYGFKGRA